jgi:hypothetical protein
MTPCKNNAKTNMDYCAKHMSNNNAEPQESISALLDKLEATIANTSNFNIEDIANHKALLRLLNKKEEPTEITQPYSKPETKKKYKRHILPDMHTMNDPNKFFDKYLYVLPYHSAGNKLLYLVTKEHVNVINVNDLNINDYKLLDNPNVKDAAISYMHMHNLKFDYSTPAIMAFDIEVLDRKYETEEPKFPECTEYDRFTISIISTHLITPDQPNGVKRSYFISQSIHEEIDNEIPGVDVYRIRYSTETSLCLGFIQDVREMAEKYGYLILNGFNCSSNQKRNVKSTIGRFLDSTYLSSFQELRHVTRVKSLLQ